MQSSAVLCFAIVILRLLLDVLFLNIFVDVASLALGMYVTASEV